MRMKWNTGLVVDVVAFGCLVAVFGLALVGAPMTRSETVGPAEVLGSPPTTLEPTSPWTSGWND